MVLLASSRPTRLLPTWVRLPGAGHPNVPAYQSTAKRHPLTRALVSYWFTRKILSQDQCNFSVGIGSKLTWHNQRRGKTLALSRRKKGWNDLGQSYSSCLHSCQSLYIGCGLHEIRILTRQDALIKDRQEQRQAQEEKQKLERQQAFQCYLLGKQLWLVEEAYGQFPFKRRVLDLPDSMAQTVRVQQVVLIAHELDLDVQPFLNKVYEAKANTLNQVGVNHDQEKGIERDCNCSYWCDTGKIPARSIDSIPSWA